MKYGKHIIEKSYADGKVVSTKGWYQENLAIADTSTLLTEVLAAMDVFVGGMTDDMELTFKRNREGKLMLVKKQRVS